MSGSLISCGVNRGHSSLITGCISLFHQFSSSLVSDCLQPHGLQPTRLLRPWDFPGKSTGVGCQIMVFTYLVFLKSFCMCLLTHCVNSSLYQLSSVTQSCLTLCNTMDYSTPSLPVHHQLLELTQTHVHWVSDGIQSSHPPLAPSPPAFNPSQHKGFFQWVCSSHQVAKVLEFQLRHQSF